MKFVAEVVGGIIITVVLIAIPILTTLSWVHGWGPLNAFLTIACSIEFVLILFKVFKEIDEDI